MQRVSSPLVLAILQASLIALAGLATLHTGNLYIDTHEIDLFHVVDIVNRMAAGLRPHVDFMTPLGALSFWPFLALQTVTDSVGPMLQGGQILVAALSAPVILYVGLTRLKGIPRITFVLLCTAMPLALVPSGLVSGPSISNFYNRWGWCWASALLLLLLLPNRRLEGEHAANGWDATVAALLMCALAMLKATFFVGLAPAVLLWVIRERAWLFLAVSGSVFLGLTLLLGGFDYWIAYVGDVFDMVGVDTLKRANGGIFGMLVEPMALPVFGLVLLAIVATRQREAYLHIGVMLLVLLPGLAFIQYQSWGHDPIWALAVGLVLIAAFPSRSRIRTLGVGVVALSLPAQINYLGSIANAVAINDAAHRAALETGPFESVRVEAGKKNQNIVYKQEEPFGGAGYDYEGLDVTFLGETVSVCFRRAGLFGQYETIAAQLPGLGVEKDDRLISGEGINLYWAYGFRQPDDLAPWYYLGTDGFAAADWLVVHTCPDRPDQARYVLQAVESVSTDWEQIHQDDLFRLYRRVR
ncbi:hypothetical protein [Oceanomicrobium pacificus]|uniref:DUF2029 domain-containing protein n=1 Tax=Oceanomicrobium pacificus TaxID=2692916 RepID=A0A6B0TUR9_9RHOB|nr:hypothetical protein [Oceanomicrobium pacificus]MXU65328.1 hypothetical protein [Oceanomicrobium pacificus]